MWREEGGEVLSSRAGREIGGGLLRGVCWGVCFRDRARLSFGELIL